VTVTLTGVGFTAACQVEVAGAGRMTTTFVNTTTLTALIPPAILGPPGNRASVFVTCAGASQALPIESKGPAIISVSPNSTLANSQDLTLTIDESFFAPGALMAWNGNPPSLQTQFVSPARLTVTLPASLLGAAGTNTVTVLNVGGYASNAVAFTVGTAQPQLSLLGITPDVFVATGPLSVITLTGSGFTKDAVVEINGESVSTTFVSETRLIAGLLARMIATPGTLDVRVRLGSRVSNSVPISVSGAPSFAPGSVVNLAGGVAIAPGSLISIYGYNLAAGDAVANGAPAPTILNGTSVRVNGVPIPLLFVSRGQINAQMPYEAPAGVVNVEIQTGSLTGRAFAIVSETGPGVWHLPGSSQVIGINIPEGSLNDEDHPIRPGQFITLFLTGQGRVTNPVPTGAAAPGSPFSEPLAPVVVTIAGVRARVAFAGLAPGFIGLLQLNVEIPEVAPGQQRFEITIGEQAANPATISIGTIE
jgi:uncharacterized protein (TIGR03437 family)